VKRETLYIRYHSRCCSYITVEDDRLGSAPPRTRNLRSCTSTGELVKRYPVEGRICLPRARSSAAGLPFSCDWKVASIARSEESASSPVMTGIPLTASALLTTALSLTGAMPPKTSPPPRQENQTSAPGSTIRARPASLDVALCPNSILRSHSTTRTGACPAFSVVRGCCKKDSWNGTQPLQRMHVHPVAGVSPA
jgi:hypothetical protein